jgi:hypothetical protein
VLDAGAAEGLISMELAKAGAIRCVGLEIVANHVAIGRELIGDLPVTLELANLNHYDVSQHGRADIVLMLAILHKLKDPSAVCAALAAQCNDLCVIRLPPYGQVIVDARSYNVEHDIGAVMKEAGFVLESEGNGPFGEWIGYFRRAPVAVEPEAAAPESEPANPEPELQADEMVITQARPRRTRRAETVEPIGTDHVRIDPMA